MFELCRKQAKRISYTAYWGLLLDRSMTQLLSRELFKLAEALKLRAIIPIQLIFTHLYQFARTKEIVKI